MPSFDGTNLVITLDSGVIEVDVETDLYSDWKEWFKIGTNSRYPLAFRTFGGDALTATVDAGAYFVFRNNSGWRIRPAEEDATVLMIGNLAPEDSTLPILIPTIGNYRVLIQGLQPITQNIDNLPDLVWAHASALAIYRKMYTRLTISSVRSQEIMYDENDVPIMQANLWKDEGRTTPYDGTGIAVRDQFVTYVP